MRLPSAVRPVWNPDEGFLATQARQLAAGGRLYETVVDRKPPLLPWLYEASFAAFGDGSLWPLKAAAGVAVLTGALLTASTARRRFGERAGWLAGVLYVLLSVGLSPEDTQAATFEVFMLPCTVAAMWCADRGRLGLAGLAVAGAALTKQTGGAVLVPAVCLLWRCRRGRRAGAAARLLVGAALPVVAVALALGPGRFTYWTLTGSGAYLSASGAVGHALVRAAANGGVLVLACAPVLAVLTASRLSRLSGSSRLAAARRRRSRGAPARTGAVAGRAETGAVAGRAETADLADVWVWLAASAAATAVGLQFYGHYFLQLLPPLALLCAAGLSVCGRRAVRTAVAGTALLTAGFVAFALTLAPRAELDHARRLSAAVRARTTVGDRVLVWGMHPEDYWFAGRRPASRYLTAGFLTNYSGGRGDAGVRVGERYAMPGAWRYFRRELRCFPPELVVDDARGKPYGLGRTPTLRRYVQRHYRRVATVGGAVLYARYTRTQPTRPDCPQEQEPSR